MTPDKAIDTLRDMCTHQHPPKLPDELKALQLGIEALKAVKVCRQFPERYIPKLLSGETEG